MPLIDKSIFNELKQISGDFINELIDAFLEDAPNMLNNMKTALEAKDAFESFRRNAHSMKSNANTFGAMELGVLAKELEFMAKENNLDVGNRLEVLTEAYRRVAEELKGMRA